MRRGAMSVPAVRWLVIARAMSAVAMMVQLTAAGWYIVQTTGSATAVGVLAALTFAPAVIGAPVGGWLADRYNIQRLGVLLRLLEVIPALIIGLLTLDSELTLPILYVLVFLGAIPSALGTPIGGMLPQAAAPAHLRHEAIADAAVAYNLARMIGPLIGSALVALISIGGAFLFNALVLLISGLIYRGVKLPPDQIKVSPTATKSKYLQDVRRGWGFDVVRIALAGTLVFFGLVAPIQQMMPAVADSHGDSVGLLGVMLAAIAVGGVVINPVIRKLHDAGWSSPLLVYSGVTVSGACMFLLGLSNWFVVDVVLLVLLGAAWEVLWVSAKAAIQLQLPRELTGRIVGLFYAAVTLGTAAGSLLLGVLFEFAGPRIPLIVTGVLACTYGLVGIRHAKRLHEERL